MTWRGHPMCHHDVRDKVTLTETESESTADEEEEADEIVETPVADD